MHKQTAIIMAINAIDPATPAAMGTVEGLVVPEIKGFLTEMKN